ncbi:MAG: hypothetical protein PHW34_03225 [Hespellia sp.]|nr:hypothetical protein [Hespellia sp.]
MYDKLKEKFGSNPLDATDHFRCVDRMEQIRIFADESGHGNEKYIDDITWNDLEMDEIFYRINQTKSYIGEQFLYQRLHDLDADRDWRQFERQQDYFTKNPKERLSIEMKLCGIGKQTTDYYLPVFLNYSKSYEMEHTAIYHVMQTLLFFFIAASILTLGNEAAVLGLLAMCLANFSVYLFTKRKYEVYMHSLSDIGLVIELCNTFLKDEKQAEILGVNEFKAEIAELNRLSRKIGNFQKRKYGAMNGNPDSVIWEYVMGITLYDISMFNHMMKIVEHNQHKIWNLYCIIGMMDAGISVASFRAGILQYCQPEFTAENIEVEGIYHPLIENCISNDFMMTSNSLITGANASGKSTFMKTIALNTILAQTIHTCTAVRMQIPALAVMTSMTLRDDVISGESYYIREIKYLRRMIDLSDQKIPVLCIIDEILKGTNTRERIAASEAILKYFSKTNSLVMVASHDTELIEKMRGQYDSYYFESQIMESEIQFDYHIHKGIGGNVNAIALLKCFGYPEEITSMAAAYMK